MTFEELCVTPFDADLKLNDRVLIIQYIGAVRDNKMAPFASKPSAGQYTPTLEVILKRVA